MKIKTVAEASACLGVPRRTILMLLRIGKVGYLRSGKRVLVDVDELEAVVGEVKAYVTIDEAVTITGLKRYQLLRGIREGWLPVISYGKRTVFRGSQELIDAIEKKMRGNVL